MSGPRNNLEEIKRRNNSSETSLLRTESSKPKSVRTPLNAFKCPYQMLNDC
jgi:hypothetical protein